jgi:F0F1-type ATP synthase assembly protein I
MKVPVRDLSGTSLGLELALSIVLPCAAGHWADERWRTGPWLTVLGVALGLVAGLRLLLRFAGTGSGAGSDAGDEPRGPDDKGAP